LIIADTDVLIDYLAGTQPAADQVLAYAESDSLQTSAITCFELLSGARYGKRGDTVRRLVGAIPVLPLDREAAARPRTAVNGWRGAASPSEWPTA
jgi:predicted nucleic acid-binding protein